jgi:predicted N-acetyltransferase YhbS
VVSLAHADEWTAGLAKASKERQMSRSKFTVREMQPADSRAVADLTAVSDGLLTTHFLIDAYLTITEGSEHRTVGVVAESEGYDGLVGMGTVRFGLGQFNGQLLPLAGLDNLKVREEFRGQGLGRQLAEWRVKRARAEFGGDGVIITGMLKDNYSSRAVARKWCREFVEPFHVALAPVRAGPPRVMAGITVREAEPAEYDEFAAQQNAFYQEYNGYGPVDGNQMVKLVSKSPLNRPLYHFFVAVDAAHNLLAGARAWYRGALKVDVVTNPPLPLRLMNGIFHLLPSDYVLRDIAVQGLWYRPDQLPAAQYLWEMMRWLCREEGTTLATGFDLRDPARKAVQLKPWHQPRPEITLALHGPAPIDRSRLLYVLGRV